MGFATPSFSFQALSKNASSYSKIQWYALSFLPGQRFGHHAKATRSFKLLIRN